MTTRTNPQLYSAWLIPIPFSKPSRRARKPIGLKSTIGLPSVRLTACRIELSQALQR